MRLWPVCWIMLLSTSVLSSDASAQTTLRYGGDNEIGAWAGMSPASGSTVGGSPDRKFFIGVLRYSRVLLESHNIGLRYTIDLVPSAVGMQINFRRQHPLQPFGEINGGILYFTRNVPVPGSSNFNFTFDFGAGAQYFFRPQRALTAGYMFHHVSNAETAPHNPGIDNNIIFGGVSWYW